MPSEATGILPGTLDLLILKAVSLGELHGYGVLLRVQQMTQGALSVEQGAPSIPLCTGSRRRRCWSLSGAPPTTTAGRSSTG